MSAVRGNLDGLAAFAKRMEAIAGELLVGVPGSTRDDGASMPMIAAVHEFGSPDQNIPERPFLRGGIRRGRPKFVRLNSSNLKRIVRGDMVVREALDKLGVVAVGEVKREFVVGSFEPNKPATIAKKGSSRPLIDSGQLRQSITYVIPEDES